MNALTGKTVIVTGAGSGIGAATARLAAREGARVLINDQSRVRTEKKRPYDRGPNANAIS